MFFLLFLPKKKKKKKKKKKQKSKNIDYYKKFKISNLIISKTSPLHWTSW